MKESFIFYKCFFEAIECFECRKAKLRLYDAFINYSLNGKIPKNFKKQEEAVFILFKFIQDKYSILQNKDFRYSIAYQNWRKAVLERDFYTCQICGCKEDLHAHHIKHFAKEIDKRFDIDNGITLCKICHQEMHRRKYNDGR